MGRKKIEKEVVESQGTNNVSLYDKDKILNVQEYATKHGIMNNFDKAGSIVKALNMIDQELGLVDVWAVGESVVCKVRGKQ